MFRTIVLVSTLYVVIGSCKIADKDSWLTDIPNAQCERIAKCACKQPASSGLDGLTDAYLKNLMTSITQANTNVFRGNCDARNICITSVIPSGIMAGPTFAGADPDSCEVFIGKGLILKARNDADLVGIIAHELAHIVAPRSTMPHFTSSPNNAGLIHRAQKIGFYPPRINIPKSILDIRKQNQIPDT